MLKKLIELFIRTNGRNPNKLELLQLRFKASQQAGKGQVVEFPPSAITDWKTPRPTVDDIADDKVVDQMYRTSGPRSLDEDKMYLAEFIAEDAGKVLDDLPIAEQNKFIKRAENALRRNVKQYQGKKADVTELDEPLVDEFARTETLASPTRIKQGFSTQSKLNSWSQNQQWVKDFIGRKNAEFNSLNRADQKEVLEMFEAQIKKHRPKEPKASGGIAGGGLAPLLGEPTYEEDNHRVPYRKGKKVRTGVPSDVTTSGLLDINFDHLDLEEWFDILKSLGVSKHASGGRVPFALGKIVKGGNWLIKSLRGTREQLKTMNMSPGQLKYYLDQIDDQIKSLEAGGKIPEEVIQTIRKDPKFKSVWQNKLSVDPDLREMEEVLLEYGKKHASGGRIGFSEGRGPKMSRRTFLKGLGTLAALPVVGRFFKWAKPAAKVADLTSVPIHNAEGMPKWFKPLVNRVIKEGTETTKLPPNKGGAYLNRQIVHSKKLGEGQGVRVYQNLDDQTINVEYQSADNMGGVDDGIVHLEYRAPQDIYDIGPASVMSKEYQAKKKALGQYPTKSKAEFEAHEAYPLQDPKDYKTITFESDNTVSNVDDLLSDTSALKQFGTNKALTKKELEIAKQKRKQVKKINEDPSEELAGSGPDSDPYDDFASGGRVPLAGGKKVLQGLAKLMDEFFPGTTKVGKRSKPFPGKVQEKMDVRKAIADFQERQKAAKLKELKTWEDPDKVRAAVDDIFSTGDYKMDAQMASEALVENNPKAFGNKLFDDLDDKTRSDIYGAVVNVVQRDLAKMLQLKRASKSKPIVVDDDFGSAMAEWARKNDPEGYAKIQKVVDDANQQLELKRFKTKGRKPNASGGLAGMLGE